MLIKRRYKPAEWLVWVERCPWMCVCVLHVPALY